MLNDKHIWVDFLAWCQRERDDARSQLRSLQSGEMRLGKRGPDTAGEWTDVTDDEIGLLRRSIAGLEGVMASARENLSTAEEDARQQLQAASA